MEETALKWSNISDAEKKELIAHLTSNIQPKNFTGKRKLNARRYCKCYRNFTANLQHDRVSKNTYGMELVSVDCISVFIQSGHKRVARNIGHFPQFLYGTRKQD